MFGIPFVQCEGFYFGDMSSDFAMNCCAAYTEKDSLNKQNVQDTYRDYN
jgi:hypothetical protein